MVIYSRQRDTAPDAAPDAAARLPQLLEAQRGALTRYAARRVGRDFAEDVASEAIVRGLSASPHRSAETATAWLFGIATNVIREHHRAEQRHLRLLERLVVARKRTPKSQAGRYCDPSSLGPSGDCRRSNETRCCLSSGASCHTTSAPVHSRCLSAPYVHASRVPGELSKPWAIYKRGKHVNDEKELRASELGRALTALAHHAERAQVEARRFPVKAAWLRRAVPVAAICVGISAAGATAAALLTGTEVDRFSEDAGISTTRARSLLADQRLAPRLDRELRERLGHDYGGLWIDNNGTVLTVGMATNRSAKRAALIGSTASHLGVATTPTVRWGLRVSIGALEHTQHRLEARFAAANFRASDTVDVEVDIRRNRIVLETPSQTSGAQQEAIAVALAEPEVPVTVEAGKPRLIFR